jgi:SNF family Na+-dependent transporter
MDSRANLFESQNLREIESNANIGKVPGKVKIKEAQEIQQWDNPIEFLMTCIGYAVGIGGVIRFPYLCFQNGGCAFVIAFLIMLFFFGVPLFFLELTISQYSKCGADKVWKVIPLLKGLGLCSVAINTYFCIYFNVLISYSVIYLVGSFMPNIPWIGCDNWWNDERCIQANNMMNVSSHLVNVSSLSVNNSMNISWQSTSEQFFYNYVLEMSSGVDDPNGMNYKVAAALFFCWIMAFFALIKGISSLGKVSYFTAIFPYIMITILIIRGVTLDGAMKGLEFYILTVDMAKLLTLQTCFGDLETLPPRTSLYFGRDMELVFYETTFCIKPVSSHTPPVGYPSQLDG